MSKTSKIRRLDLHDLDQHYMDLLNEFAPVFTTLEEMKRCYLDRSFAGTCPTFLYLSDCGRPLGSITVQLVDKMIYRQPYAFLDDFIVAEEFRKKGIGKDLVRHAINYCHNKGCFKIILDCAPALEKYYGGFGFYVNGTTMRLDL